MEESEKRRERLRGLRLEAANSETLRRNHNYEEPPRLPPPPLGVDYQQPPRGRFDYYTDPLSAYSSHRQHQPRPRPRPPPGSGSTHYATPHYNYNNNNNRPYYPPTPTPTPRPYYHPHPIHAPSFPLHQPTPFTPPHFSNTPTPGSGRGRGRAQTHPSTTGRPHTHTRTSMLDDPWKHLKPVLWHSDPTFPNSWGHSLKLTSIAQPNQPSLRMTSTAKLNPGPVRMNYVAKKPRVSNTEPSLADFLAAAAAEAQGHDSPPV